MGGFRSDLAWDFALYFCLQIWRLLFFLLHRVFVFAVVALEGHFSITCFCKALPSRHCFYLRFQAVTLRSLPLQSLPLTSTSTRRHCCLQICSIKSYLFTVFCCYCNCAVCIVGDLLSLDHRPLIMNKIWYSVVSSRHNL